MKSQKKRLSAAIALALTFAFTVIAAIPVTFGKTPLTLAFTSTLPNPAGRGQSVYVVGWVSPPAITSGAVLANYTFTITKPDGTIITKFIPYSNQDATASFNMVVDQVGVWSVVLSYPGDDWHDAVTSSVDKFVVQEEAVANTNPDVPLPSGPWYWPINAQNQQWFWISGAWPNAWYDASGCSYNPYSYAPNTPHVLWVNPMLGGGLFGGNETVYDKLSDPTQPIVAGMGRMYYRYSSNSSNLVHAVIVCLDIKTGQTIWQRDMPSNASRPSAGGPMALYYSGRLKEIQEEVTNISNPVETVSTPERYELWMVGSGIWRIDPWTGDCTYYNSNAAYSSSSGKGTNLLMDANGNIVLLNYPTGNMSLFDTRTLTLDWNVRAPAATDYASNGQPWLDVQDGYLMGVNRPTGGKPFGISFTTWDLKDGHMVVNASIAAGGIYTTSGTHGGIVNGEVITHLIDRYWYAIDLTTGQQRWKSDQPSDYPWGDFNEYMSCNSADYGLYYQGQYDGHMYAIDVNTGKIVWKFFTGNDTDIASGYMIPWGRQVIADKKLYFVTGEHDAPNPLPRGNTLFCLNALTGELIWKFRGFMDRGANGGNTAGISGGIMWVYNLYDGRLYAFGKGQTTTTVSAPETAIPLGDGVLIQGTVMDQSPASPGTPAIADADQEAYMEYLYTQNQVLPNAKGVTVHLQAMVSDGNLMDVTHVTTDAMGHYEYTWTPPSQGTYKIIATFEGSESYYSSSGQAGLSVGAAAPTPATPEAAPDNTPMFIGSTSAIIIAIAIVGILLLRKRP